MVKKRRSRILWISSGIAVILLIGATIAGILGLLSHVMIPAKRLGIMAAIGISFALLVSLVFLPAVMSLLKRPKPIIEERKSRRFSFERNLLRAGKVVARYPGRIIVIMSTITIILVAGVSFLRVDSNVINFFPKNHDTRITARMGGNRDRRYQGIFLSSVGGVMFR